MSLSANYQAIDKIVQQLQTELEQAKRERDAAIKDMQLTPITLCAACSNYRTEYPCGGGKYYEQQSVMLGCTMFEWRGVQEDT